LGSGYAHPASIRLDLKDRPIPLTAIEVKAGYLLTRDARHFDHFFYGRRIAGVVRPRSISDAANAVNAPLSPCSFGPVY
jgi:hypothetical protein